MQFKPEHIAVLTLMIIIVTAAFVVFATGVFIGIALD